MAETEACLYCKESFEITRYGRRVPCPHCGGLLDIYPESNLWLDTPIGRVGVNTEQVKALLSFLLPKGGN